MLPVISSIIAKINWEAPIEIPIQIESKIKAKLYGSFIAVRNLTTERAPTNPKDNARDDLTTAIKLATDIVISKMLFPKLNLEEKELLKELNKYLKINPDITENANVNKLSLIPKLIPIAWLTIWFVICSVVMFSNINN